MIRFAFLFTLILSTLAPSLTFGQELETKRRRFAGPDYVQSQADRTRIEAVTAREQALIMVDQAVVNQGIQKLDAHKRLALVDQLETCIIEIPPEEFWRCEEMKQVHLQHVITQGAGGISAGGNVGYMLHNVQAMVGANFALTYQNAQGVQANARAVDRLAGHVVVLYDNDRVLADKVGELQGAIAAKEAVIRGLSVKLADLAQRAKTGDQNLSAVDEAVAKELVAHQVELEALKSELAILRAPTVNKN